MLTRVFYISEIVEPLTDIDVKTILCSAQVNNRRLDITGMLAQSDGHFAQLLEGRTEVVRDLMRKISADRRHSDLRVLLEDSIGQRQFARWSMGLIRRDDMADEMRKAHEEGCLNNAVARRLIDHLMWFEW